jgi:cell division protease FtsH
MPDDRKSMNKRFAENRIAMAMGGRIAEELMFGDLNSGAASDIDSATDIARAMVTEWGMSEKLGPLAFGGKQGEVFLGRDFSQQQNYSEQTSQTIDAEVHRIVMAQYERARALVAGHMDQLGAIAQALLVYETLDGADLKVLMEGGSITRSRPSVRIKTREQLEQERESRHTPALGGLGGRTPEPAT